VRRLVAAAMAAWTLMAGVAQACYTGAPRHSSVGLNRAKKIARMTHEVWTADWRAHGWQGRISCESGFRKWVTNGQYWGLTKMGENERDVTRWDWPMIVQLRASKRWEKAGGNWSCPLG